METQRLLLNFEIICRMFINALIVFDHMITAMISKKKVVQL